MEIHLESNVSCADLYWCQKVRGAPAIGVVAALSLAVELHLMTFTSVDDLTNYVLEKMDYLISARPTAVNVVDAKRKFVKLFQEWSKESETKTEDIKKRFEFNSCS